MLSLVRELIALRRDLPDAFELLDAPAGVVAYRRDGHTVAINTSDEPVAVPLSGTRAYTNDRGRRCRRRARPARRSDCRGLDAFSEG